MTTLTLWTIGHSTHPIARFLELLTAQRIEALADVRRYPASRRHPQFARESLEAALSDAGLRYVWLPELGGRRKPRRDSPNAGWHNEGFRGYADYMETEPFRAGIERLLALARERRTAFMCAEAAWQQCHRGPIADYLKASGIEVLHILRDGETEPHPWTKPARVIEGRLTYPEESPGQSALDLDWTGHR